MLNGNLKTSKVNTVDNPGYLEPFLKLINLKKI
jgi:hypothetical protein